MDKELHLEGWQYTGSTFNVPKVAIKSSGDTVVVSRLKDSVVVFKKRLKEMKVSHTKWYLTLSSADGDVVVFCYNHPEVNRAKRSLPLFFLAIVAFSLIFSNSDVIQAIAYVTLLVISGIWTARLPIGYPGGDVGYAPIKKLRGEKQKQVYKFFKSHGLKQAQSLEYYQKPTETSNANKDV